MILNSYNIEDIVLRNPGLLNKLSHHKDQIQQWTLGQMIPALRSTGQKAKIDFLNKLTKEDLDVIREHLNLKFLTIESLDYSIVKNHTSNITDIENFLNIDNVMLNDFCVSREGEQLYICTWR